MKLLIINLVLICFPNIDVGNIGRYEVELRTKFGDEFKAYITIATYDKLESVFDSDEKFKDFLFNVYGLEQLDSLQFYKKFHFVNFPEYNSRNEKLTFVLQEDWINLAKSDIGRIKFKSFKKTDYIGFQTKLSLKEIKQFQIKPEFIDKYSIDEHQEAYSDLWILSYNPKMKSSELSEIVKEMKNDYESKTAKGKDDENSWVYRKMISKWQIKLKKMEVYLIEVSNP